MTFKTTVMYEFEDHDAYTKFYTENIEPLFLTDIDEQSPVRVSAISQGDMFQTLDDIEELINDDGVDSYELVEGIQNIIDDQFKQDFQTALDEALDEMVKQNQQMGLYDV